MNRPTKSVALADSLALPAMKLLASLNLLFLALFLGVFVTAMERGADQSGLASLASTLQ